jgi:hypothetical protein
MTEQQYRNLDIDSYSSLKLFIEDRKKYYRKFIIREPVKEEESPSTIFGSLVDCLKFTPEVFEERYALAVAQPPTGQYGKFVDQLMRVTLRSLNEAGEITRELEDMMLDAYNEVKHDRDGNVVDFKRDSFEVVKNKFIGSNLEIHYRQLREAYGKTIIEASNLENAQAVVRELNSNPITRDIMTCRSDQRFTVYSQFPIVGLMPGSYTQNGDFPLKCLIDRLIVDHEEKVIRIYDLKTVWDNEGEFLHNYFKYKYYIQMALYFYLVVQWKYRQEEIKDYNVLYPQFIAVDSSNYKSPLIYSTDVTNYDQGMNGFTIRGKYYPGVLKAVQDLIWHKESGIWTISKDAHLAGGKVKISPFLQ